MSAIEASATDSIDAMVQLHGVNATRLRLDTQAYPPPTRASLHESVLTALADRPTAIGESAGAGPRPMDLWAIIYYCHRNSDVLVDGSPASVVPGTFGGCASGRAIDPGAGGMA